MSNVTTTIPILNNREEIEILSATSSFSGYGHRTITVTIRHNGKTASFSSRIGNMSTFDKAMDIEDYETRILALFELIQPSVNSQIQRFVYAADKAEIIQIDREMAKSIVEANPDSLRWNDGTSILGAELVTYFMLEVFPNGRIDLAHRLEDYRIEQIKFS